MTKQNKVVRAWAIVNKHGGLLNSPMFWIYESYYVARSVLDPLERLGHKMVEVEIRPLKRKKGER